MRGTDARSGELYSYVGLEKWVPAKHPLRVIRVVVNDVLAGLDGDFSKACADSYGWLQFRWTRQSAPAALRLAHIPSAASRLLRSTRTRAQIGAVPPLSVVRTTSGSYPFRRAS
jgi:hypothetical protein